MTKQDKLKKMLKPLIKECIGEILVERGLISMFNEQVSAQQQALVPQSNQATSRILKEKKRRFVNERAVNPAIQKMKDDIKESLGVKGKSFDPFKGTKALKSGGQQGPPTYHHAIEDLEEINTQHHIVNEAQEYEYEETDGPSRVARAMSATEARSVQSPGVNIDSLFGSSKWGAIFERTGEIGENK